MSVRAFTADESSGLVPAVRGSYLGLIDKVRLPILSLVATSNFLVFRFPHFYFSKITCNYYYKLLFLLI